MKNPKNNLVIVPHFILNGTIDMQTGLNPIENRQHFLQFIKLPCFRQAIRPPLKIGSNRLLIGNKSFRLFRASLITFNRRKTNGIVLIK